MKPHLYIRASVIILFFLFSCEKPERTNPWDEKAKLDPSAWAPQNLQVEDVTISEKKLTWEYDDKSIEGFKLDRKKGDEAWQVAYQTFPKETRSWNDTEIIPDPELTYSYRIYAYAGRNSSSQQSISASAELASPTGLEFTINSITAVTLSWEYSITGHYGFKIDRKVNEGAWEMGFATVNSDTTFTQNGLDLNNNVYYFRVYAYYNIYESLKTENLVTLKCGYPFTDSRDGNKYETIQIGDQCWMKKNLAYLPIVSPSSTGSSTSNYYYVHGYQGTNVTEAKATANYQTYGVLYNWPASLTACPQGWSLPTDDEWTVLTDYLGGTNIAGGKMKEAGTAHWNSPNTGATNSSGFSCLPAGYRYFAGNFGYLGDYGYWWSSSERSSSYAWLRILGCDYEDVYRDDDSKKCGFSVRCLRDY